MSSSQRTSAIDSSPANPSAHAATASSSDVGMRRCGAATTAAANAIQMQHASIRSSVGIKAPLGAAPIHAADVS